MVGIDPHKHTLSAVSAHVGREGRVEGLAKVVKPEVVKHGENGLLVEYGDMTGLAESLRQLLDDQEMRLRMGRANSRRSEVDFNWDKIARLTIACYEAVTKPISCHEA